MGLSAEGLAFAYQNQVAARHGVSRIDVADATAPIMRCAREVAETLESFPKYAEGQVRPAFAALLEK